MPDRQGKGHRFALVGLGYTGTSLGLALRRAYSAAIVAGHDRDAGAAKAALKAGAVTKTHWNLIDACDGAQVVFLALPAREVIATLAPLANELAQGVIISDTASIKAPIVRWAAANLAPTVHYVGGHPLLRRSEPASADACRGCTYCLTPVPDTDPGAVAIVADVVAAIGANAVFLDPGEHDGMMLYLRQMPALAAAAALQLAAESDTRTDLRALRGALSPEAVSLAAELEPLAGTLLQDSDLAPLRAWLDRYIGLLQRLRAALEPGDEADIDEAVSGLDAGRAFWENEPAERPGSGTDDARSRGESWRRLLGMR